MKRFAVHHIHVKDGKEIYTISHDGGCVSLKNLEKMIKNIKNERINNEN